MIGVIRLIGIIICLILMWVCIKVVCNWMVRKLISVLKMILFKKM